MKRTISYVSALLLITAACFIISSGTLTALSEAPALTIVDYYLQLPDEYFNCETDVPLSKKDKLALIKKKDLAGSYILAATKEGGFPLEAAVYRDDYLGIEVLAVNVRCGSGCMCRKLDFFFINNLNLSKDTKGYFFPKAADIEKATGVTEGYGFVLSGDGKSIKVVKEGSGRTLVVIGWSGGTFNLP